MEQSAPGIWMAAVLLAFITEALQYRGCHQPMVQEQYRMPFVYVRNSGSRKSNLKGAQQKAVPEVVKFDIGSMEVRVKNVKINA